MPYQNPQTFFKVQRIQNIISLYWLHCLCYKQVFAGCFPKERDFMVTRYFFDVVLFLYEVLFPWQQHTSKSTLFLFLLLHSFSKHCLAQKLVFTVGPVLAYDVFSAFIVLCNLFFFHFIYCCTDLCLSQYIISQVLQRITLVIL